MILLLESMREQSRRLLRHSRICSIASVLGHERGWLSNVAWIGFRVVDGAMEVGKIYFELFIGSLTLCMRFVLLAADCAAKQARNQQAGMSEM